MSSYFLLPFPLNRLHTPCKPILVIFCMRVLNEKYIQAQQKNNENRTNSVTHISVVSLSHRTEKEKRSRGVYNEEETNLSWFLFSSSERREK